MRNKNIYIFATHFIDTNKMTEKNILNQEIILDINKTIVSKTDTKGIIEYANDYFQEISGYTEKELLGQPHNIIRHPDMPKVVFKKLWEALKMGRDIRVAVKNLAKDGRYYWVITNFFIVKDEQGNTTGYYARRKNLPKHVKVVVEDLYKKLITIEKEAGMEVAEQYLASYLEGFNTCLNDFVEYLFGEDKEMIEAYLKREITDKDILDFEKTLNLK